MIPSTLSTLSTRSIEEVAAVNPGRNWFQVYVWKDRGLVEEMVRRAGAAGFDTIVPTVDLATFGRRERDVRRTRARLGDRCNRVRPGRREYTEYARRITCACIYPIFHTTYA